MKFMKYITSMQLGLFLFFLIGLTTFAGSIIPQGQPILFYDKHFGELRGGIITALGFHQVYSSPWFAFLGLLLGLNLTACTVQRLVVLVQKPTLRRAGSLLLHAGLILVLVGGYISAMDKHEHYFEAQVGEIRKLSELGFPFDLKIQDFNIEYFNNIQPKQYRTRIQVLEKGLVRKEKEISVNHPLKYAGIKVYQFGYGWLIGGEIISDRGTEKVMLRQGEVYQLSDTPLLIMKVKFYPDYAEDQGEPASLSPGPRNPRVTCQIYSGTEYLGGKALAPGESITKDGYTFLFSTYHNLTGLQIKKDRGIPYVWAGFVLLVMGIFIRYLSPNIRKNL